MRTYGHLSSRVDGIEVENQGSDGYGCNGDSLLADKFGETTQLYSRVLKIYRNGKLGDKS